MSVPNFYERILSALNSKKGWALNDGTNNNPSITFTGVGYTGQDTGSLQLSYPANSASTKTLYTPYVPFEDITGFDKVDLYFRSSALAYTAFATSGINVAVGNNSANAFYWNLGQAQLSAGTNAWAQIELPLTGAVESGTVDQTNISYIGIQPIKDAATGAGIILFDQITASRYFDHEYDIELDGVGYQLVEESYVREDLPPIADRFSTGDITYSDFDIYQYHAQTDWSGGWNDVKGIEDNTFYDGYNINTKNVGEIRQGRGLLYIASIAAASGMITSIQEYKNSAFFGVSAGSNSSRVMSIAGLTGISSISAVVQTTVAKSAVIDQIVFRDQLWASFGNPDSATNTMQMFDGATWSAVSQSGMYFAELNGYMYTMDTASNMRSFDGTTWSTEYTDTGWKGHRMATWRDKVWYLATKGSSTRSQQTSGALFYFDGVNRVQVKNFDGILGNSLEVYQDKIWFVENGILQSFDGERFTSEHDITDRYLSKFALDIYSSATATTDYLASGKGIQAIGNSLSIVGNKAEFSGFILQNNRFGFSPLYVVDEFSNPLRSITALGAYIYKGAKYLLAAFYDGSTLLNIVAEPNSEDLAASASDKYMPSSITSSWIDADLFSVDKLWKSIQVYFKEPLWPGDTFSIRAYIQLSEDDDFQEIGLIAYDNSNPGDFADRYKSFIELQLPNDCVSNKIRYKLDFIATNTPITITDIAVKYILSPDTKHRWTFNVILANDVLNNANVRDSQDGYDKSLSLWETRLKKNLVNFRDVDNQIYDVVVNRVRIQGPNVEEGGEPIENGPEYVAVIELIEAS